MRLLPGAAAVGALLVLNIWMVATLFHTAYTVEMGSIEAAYISLAHYILHHFSSFSAATWFPLLVRWNSLARFLPSAPAHSGCRSGCRSTHLARARLPRCLRNSLCPNASAPLLDYSAPGCRCHRGICGWLMLFPDMRFVPSHSGNSPGFVGLVRTEAASKPRSIW